MEILAEIRWLMGTPTVRLRIGIPVTVTFGQPVSGFGIDDLTVTNGHAERLAGEAPGTDYSFDVVPTAIGVVTVDVADDAVQNPAGQGNVATPQLLVGIPYDDDHDGVIGLPEAIAAVRDYFTGQITVAEAIVVLSRYFSGG